MILDENDVVGMMVPCEKHLPPASDWLKSESWYHGSKPSNMRLTFLEKKSPPKPPKPP